MTEAVVEPTTEEPAAQPTEPADTTDWKAEARKWEQRAKVNSDAAAKAKELEKAQRAAMTEADRSVAEAEERGRTSARTEYGQRLVRSDFTAIAARRNSGFDAGVILDDLNLARYIGEDGEPDLKAIEKAVERLVPEGATGQAPVSMDLGVKQTATAPPNMNQQIRKAAGRA